LGGRWIITIPIHSAAHADIAIITDYAQRCRTPTTSIIGGITGRADLGHALARRRIITIPIIGTAHTAANIARDNTDRGVPATTGIIGAITQHTGLGHTLAGRAITVIIAPAAHTPIAIATGHTNGRRTATTSAIGWITGLAGTGDTLAVGTITIIIASALQTGELAIDGLTKWGVVATAAMVALIAELARSVDALAGTLFDAVGIHCTQTADISIGRRSTIPLYILAALVGVGITFTALAATANGFACFIAIEAISTRPTARPIDAFVANRRVALTAHIGEQLAHPTLALGTHREVGIITIVIAHTLGAFAPVAPSTAKWRITATAVIAAKNARLALALLALARRWIITIGGITASHTERAELLDGTKWRWLIATGMIGRITRATLTGHAEWGKALLAIVMVEAGDALGIALAIASTKWGVSPTAGIVGDITGLASIIDALTRIVGTVIIVGTGHTFGAIISIDTDPLLPVATVMVARVADRTATRHTRRGLLGTILIA